jgi:hypothetical protein
MHVMFAARLVFVVMISDQFETVRANDIDPADLAQAKLSEFRTLPLTGPLHVAVDMPRDVKMLGDIFRETARTGKVVALLPRFYVPYAQKCEQAAMQDQPLEPMLKHGGDFATLAQETLAQDYLASSGRKAAHLKFLPLQTRRGYGAVLVDAKTGDIVKLLPPML